METAEIACFHFRMEGGVKKHLSIVRKTREGWNCRFRKTPRTEGWDKVPGGVDPRLAAGLPLPVPEILVFKAFHASGNLFPAIFPRFSWNIPREPPSRSQKQPP